MKRTYAQWIALGLTLCLSACSDPTSKGNARQIASPESRSTPVRAPIRSEPLHAAKPASRKTAETHTEVAAVNSPRHPKRDCSFTLPEGFEGRVVKWEGECREGKAHGNGVLRAYPSPASADKNVLIFFGSIEQGEPKLGVIETPDGYIAGELAAGKVIDTDDRNVLIRAFNQAGEAATLVSDRFKAAGNQGSAAFYAKKARNLLQQMD